MRAEILIETDRFILRELTEKDRVFFVGCQEDAEFARFHTEAERTEAHMHSVFTMMLSWRLDRPRKNFQLAIVKRSNPARYIGTAGVRTAGLAPGSGEIGVELVRDQWGQGAASEIIGAIVAWARIELGLVTLIAETAPGNQAAERLAEAVGLRIVAEGAKRQWHSDC